MTDFDDDRLNLPPAGERSLWQVTANLATLRKAPDKDAETASQSLHGEQVCLHHRDGTFGLVQNLADGYVGWTDMEALSQPARAPTHRLRALRAYVYPRPSIKSAPVFEISLGVRLVSEEQREGRFLKCARAGWLYEDQLAAVGDFESDPADVAVRYLHAPYLWGGRESVGLDCSGLVQQSFGACGIALPRDSDMQYAWAGAEIADWQVPGALRRNDLVFWKGHVGIMLDQDMFVHANGHHMAVAAEPLQGAISRIANQYGEPIGARRVDLSKARAEKPAWLNVAQALR